MVMPNTWKLYLTIDLENGIISPIYTLLSLANKPDTSNSFVVDTQCSCYKFNALEIICIHALANTHTTRYGIHDRYTNYDLNSSLYDNPHSYGLILLLRRKH